MVQLTCLQYLVNAVVQFQIQLSCGSERDAVISASDRLAELPDYDWREHDKRFQIVKFLFGISKVNWGLQIWVKISYP